MTVTKAEVERAFQNQTELAALNDDGYARHVFDTETEAMRAYLAMRLKSQAPPAFVAIVAVQMAAALGAMLFADENQESIRRKLIEAVELGIKERHAHVARFKQHKTGDKCPSTAEP